MSKRTTGVSLVDTPAFCDVHDFPMVVMVEAACGILLTSRQLRPHSLPALVLFSFRRIRIRSPVQPVVEPINIPLLRYEPLPGLDQEVRPEWNPYEFHRFVSEREA